MIKNFASEFVKKFTLVFCELYRAQLEVVTEKPLDGDVLSMAGSTVVAALEGKPSLFQIEFYTGIAWLSVQQNWAESLAFCFDSHSELPATLTSAESYPSMLEIEDTIRRLDIIQLEFWRRSLPLAESDSEALRYYKIHASLKFMGVMQ